MSYTHELINTTKYRCGNLHIEKYETLLLICIMETVFVRRRQGSNSTILNITNNLFSFVYYVQTYKNLN